MKSPIFLSASIPYGARAQQYQPDPLAVREAVHALVGLVLPDRLLVFGGHPAISPFVWEAAHSLGRDEAVVIYQSELFRKHIPKQAHYFKQLLWTRDIQNDLELSLARMRDLMIVKRKDERGNEVAKPYGAAFFIGGMEGVEEEWDVFRKTYDLVPAIPMASTQGAALRILDDRRYHVSPVYGRGKLNSALKGASNLIPELRSNLNYRSLFREILATVP